MKTTKFIISFYLFLMQLTLTGLYGYVHKGSLISLFISFGFALFMLICQRSSLIVRLCLGILGCFFLQKIQSPLFALLSISGFTVFGLSFLKSTTKSHT